MSRPDDAPPRSPALPVAARLLRLRTVAASVITAVALTGTGGAVLAPAGADDQGPGERPLEGSHTPRHTDEAAT